MKCHLMLWKCHRLVCPQMRHYQLHSAGVKFRGMKCHLILWKCHWLVCPQMRHYQRHSANEVSPYTLKMSPISLPTDETLPTAQCRGKFRGMKCHLILWKCHWLVCPQMRHYQRHSANEVSPYALKMSLISLPKGETLPTAQCRGKLRGMKCHLILWKRW